MSKAEGRQEGKFPGQFETSPSDLVLGGIFYFDPADPIYADHFPGCPVVPGSLIISAFLKAGQDAGPGKRPERIKDFKFRTFLTPGEYEYRLESRGERLQCRLFKPGTDGRHPLVTGTILCHPA